MERKTIITTVIITAFLLFCIWFIFNTEVKEIQHIGTITDKWTKNVAGFGTSTRYVFEINNNQTKAVTDFDYYNHEIGENYTWTETTVRFPLIDK